MTREATITVKRALGEADVLSAHLYLAIKNGDLRTTKSGRRRLIFRDSFEAWKRRLSLRRKLLMQAQEERSSQTARL
jgi:hypothetical protein